MSNIHIGDIIKQRVMESPMTIKEFADRINCERTSVYYLFKQKSCGSQTNFYHFFSLIMITKLYFKL